MKSLKILSNLLQDASRSLDVDMSRDWETIQSRYQHEGLSFLTITLPAFSSWLELSLEEGRALPSIFPYFRVQRGLAIPRFLQVLTKRVFDPMSGIILPEGDPSAVFFVRSICSFFKKVKAPCTRVRNALAIKKFKESDAGLPEYIELSSIERSVAHVVISSLQFFAQDDSLPKHGPGATYEKITGNRKYDVREFYERWSSVIDPEDLYGYNRIGDRELSIIGEDQEKPCRLSLVPKTLKSPRLIAVEPAAMQYAQQLCADRLIKSMRSSHLTKHIDFTDQSVNRRLAEYGSRSGQLATVDLSEASDRVSLPLVEALFGSDEELLAQLRAFRSTHIQIRDPISGTVEVLKLRKYSTSGSALTFPVETLVFFIISLAAVVEVDLRRFRSLKSAISSLAQTVNVYGDDIIVPSHTCSHVMGRLESLGLKVNRQKTFFRGPFRESCGGDFYRGYDVTPTYLRRLVPDHVSESEQMVSAVATSNILWKKGCWIAADGLRQMVDELHRLPVVQPTCSGLGWHTFRYEYTSQRVLKNNWPGVRTLCTFVRKVDSRIAGYSALLKHFLSKGVQEDPEHLTKVAPRYAMQLRLKWVSAV